MSSLAGGNDHHDSNAAQTDGLDPAEWSEREHRLTEHFAVAMHALTCGDWGAAGYETKLHFRLAAAHAVVSLNDAGLDLLDILPKGGRP